MSDVTRVEASQYTVASVPAPGSSAGLRETSGKDLPLQVPDVAAQPATVKETTTDSKAEVGERVKAAVAQMNEYIQSTQRDLTFSYDEASGETIVKVLDRNTQDVIRQIPDEIFLKIAQDIDSDSNFHFFTARA